MVASATTRLATLSLILFENPLVDIRRATRREFMSRVFDDREHSQRRSTLCERTWRQLAARRRGRPSSVDRRGKGSIWAGISCWSASRALDTVEYFKAFQERGGKTILDAVLHGDRPYWSALEPLLPYVDYFMPNDDEGYAISGMKDPVGIRRRCSRTRAQRRTATLGDKGSIYYSADEKFRADIFRTDFCSWRDRFGRRFRRWTRSGFCSTVATHTRASARDGAGNELRSSQFGDSERLYEAELEEFLDGRELKTTPLK